MKIPTYERQVVKKAAPSVAPTPVFEQERSSLQNKRNVFGIRGNLNTIANNKDLREKGYDLQRRSLDLQEKRNDNAYKQAKRQIALQAAGLVVDTVGQFANLYQTYLDTQTTKAIETYNNEMQLHDNELARQEYTLGDVRDIGEQYAELAANNFEAKEAAISKALDGIQNQKVKDVVTDYAQQNNRARMQQQWFKFEDAKKNQMRQDITEDVNSAANRGDYESIDNYLKIGVQGGLITPAEADQMDAAAEKSIINGQLTRGVNTIFENGGDAKDARDWIMQYEPVVSGRQNYVLSTEDREAFYKQIADAKKINDALIKDRNIVDSRFKIA